jgi:uncharacterized coiled-coil protein SlyX
MGADIKAEVNVIQISERLATLEAQVAHIDAATKRIEDSVAKVLSQIDKREEKLLKQVDEVELQVVDLRNHMSAMENKMAFWHGVVAVIAFAWPAILKFLL